MEERSVALKAHAPRVVCVILNWNGWQDTATCLRTALAQTYPALTTTVVDNASTDDSVARLRAEFPQIPVQQSPRNGGFAAGMNLGIQWALMHNADFVWVLNNDTTAPPDTAAKLIAAAADPKTGIVGTVLHYMHAPGNVQAWGGGRVWPSMGYVKHFDAPAPLVRDSFLTFASVLLRCRMLEEIGLMDERYFMYFEDADFCFRARQRGWKLAVAADTCVLHKVGGSSDAKNLRQDRIVTASGLRFLHRFGRPRTSAKALFVLSRLAKRLSTGQLARAGAVLQGVEDWIREKPMAFRRER